MSALGIPRHIATLDPRNVEHVLKSKHLDPTENAEN